MRASGRGEAKLCGRARGDKIVVLGLLRESFGPPPPPCVFVPVRLSTKHVDVKQVVLLCFVDNHCKTIIKTTHFADNLVKPL